TNHWDYAITLPGADVGSNASAVTVQQGSISFDDSGRLTSPAGDVTGITVSGLADGAAPLTFTWNLYEGNATLTQVAGPSGTSSTGQDGTGSGALSKFSIGSDGLVTGTFTNGKTSVLGQLALATFANVQGLLRNG